MVLILTISLHALQMAKVNQAVHAVCVVRSNKSVCE